MSSAISKALSVRLETIIASASPAFGGGADELDTDKLSFCQTPEDTDDGGEKLYNHKSDNDNVNSQDGAAGITFLHARGGGRTRESSIALIKEDSSVRELSWAESGDAGRFEGN